MNQLKAYVAEHFPKPLADGPAVFLGLYVAPAYGTWVPLSASNDPDELAEVARLVVAGWNAEYPEEHAEEYLFSDWENFVASPGENTSFEDVLALVELDEAVGERYDAFEAWLGHIGKDYALYEDHKLRPASEIVEQFEEEYCGSYDEFKDFVQQTYEETVLCNLDVPDEVAQYIDYEKIARDWEVNEYYHERVGGQAHVFTRN